MVIKKTIKILKNYLVTLNLKMSNFYKYIQQKISILNFYYLRTKKKILKSRELISIVKKMVN